MDLKILLLAISFLASFQQGNHKITKVEFSSMTRGYQESVVFTPDSVRGSKPDAGDRSKVNAFNQSLKKQDWKHLTGLVSSVPRTEFENLKSPTNKRAYDGAKHSTITITLDNGETYLHLFDDETPNEKLQPLMKCISKLRDQAQR
jgi:hypothetical protein